MFRKVSESLLKHMKTVKENKGYRLIINEGSEILFVGDDGVLLEKVFNIKGNEGCAFLKGVVSRKRQIIPILSGTIQRKMI
ncbi:MAG: DHHA2 domain-containing protein [Ruminiclostridium sp.]